ncbi:MAG TPA: EscU/YscU/HrcU family type III secretion system export apparatus switch protein [Polyangiaceae bacterium]|nr:EscU/YscU/HrcU family type III secretion system export apparatus switch protein [Polyangiaceae bacterium]
MSDKTEQPTPRRLKRAREQGDSAVSASLGQGVGFVTVLVLLPALLAALTAGAAATLRAALAGEAADPIAAAWLWLSLSAPLLGTAALVSLVLGFVQTGGAFTATRFSPDLARLSPAQGLKGLFSITRIFSPFRSLVAALAVAWLAWGALRDHAAAVAGSVGRSEAIAALAWLLARRLLWGAALVALGLGAVDYFFVRRAWLARHRMSKDEVKREHREAEGDPEVRAARRRAHQEALAGSMIAAVKNATVLIVNPTHLATALRYQEDEDEAPVVLAHGEGDLARRLIEAAHQYNVPVVRDVPIAHALKELALGEQIPEALYEAVAEVLRELLGSEPAPATANETP